MKKVEVTIRHEVGLHARPAAVFVQTASQFKSNIQVAKDGHEVNAKSILALLGLGAGKDSVVTIVAEGDDETEAIEAMQRLIKNNFDEDANTG